MTPSQAISQRILSYMSSGMHLRDAFDKVLGAGAYDRLAYDVYYELRTRHVEAANH